MVVSRSGLWAPVLTHLFGFSRYMATTQFEATDARAAFPCFDEPEFKSQFIVTLVHERDYKALSNMPVTNTISRNDGFLESRFQETVKMSTYLLAFIVCDFAYKESHTKRGNKVCKNCHSSFFFFDPKRLQTSTRKKRVPNLLDYTPLSNKCGRWE